MQSKPTPSGVDRFSASLNASALSWASGLGKLTTTPTRSSRAGVSRLACFQKQLFAMWMWRYWKNVISLCFLPRAHSLTQNLSLLLLLKCRSCSLGGYESPWAPGGAIFIPGEIMTRREYWKPFFFTVKSFLEGASWWSQLPLGPNWHLQLLQLTTFGGTRLWAPGSAGVHPGDVPNFFVS